MTIDKNILVEVCDMDIKNGFFIIPEKIIEIGAFAFSRCKTVHDVVILNNVKIIRDYAFYHCINLENITIADSVNVIYNLAFGFCENLTCFKLPHNLKNISPFSFKRVTPGLIIIFDDSQLLLAEDIKKEYGDTVELILQPYNCDVF